MNYMLAFLFACIVLGLWGPKNARWLRWLVPVGAVVLVVFFLVTHLNRIWANVSERQRAASSACHTYGNTLAIGRGDSVATKKRPVDIYRRLRIFFLIVVGAALALEAEGGTSDPWSIWARLFHDPFSAWHSDLSAWQA